MNFTMSNTPDPISSRSISGDPGSGGSLGHWMLTLSLLLLPPLASHAQLGPFPIQTNPPLGPSPHANELAIPRDQA